MMTYLFPRFGLVLTACLFHVYLSDCYGIPKVSKTVSQPVQATLSPEQIRQYAVGQIQSNLDALLEDPAVYLKTAREECKYFPEGAVYPYVMPACAYVNLALAGVIPKEEAIPKIRALLEMGVQEVARTVHAPGGDLLKIRPDNTSGSFLGILNMGLSAYGLISDDNHFKAINDHLCETFLTWFEAKGGASLQSWPNVVWHMDTTFALASLDLWKAPSQKARVKDAYGQHLKWRKHHVTLANGYPLPMTVAGRPGVATLRRRLPAWRIWILLIPSNCTPPFASVIGRITDSYMVLRSGKRGCPPGRSGTSIRGRCSWRSGGRPVGSALLSPRPWATSTGITVCCTSSTGCPTSSVLPRSPSSAGACCPGSVAMSRGDLIPSIIADFCMGILFYSTP